VTVPAFYMGKYPVTQAQWAAIAALPKIKQDLEPDPSGFRGADRPVEQVNWWEAVEFCDRLSKKTGRTYRLPSEAEWEYACRSGTTTPFHFGETITTALANYRGTDWKISENTTWSGNYGKGPNGIYREQTTSVGQFPANGFGLYDMHGNVCEWCADDWHDNYDGSPTDGSAWLSNKKDANSLLRGGSWSDDPRDCRSAVRYDFPREFRCDSFGFRVSCSAARILP
jgi:formylglycine-generating enzyme required for sulfatase activity